MRGHYFFAEIENLGKRRNPLPIGYSVERGRRGSEEPKERWGGGGVLVTMRYFLRKPPSPSPTLAVIVIR